MASKNYSGSGGYDANFVEPLLGYFECPVCLLALREPNILSCCGIKVCHPCINQIKAGGKGCPVCREDFSTMLEKQMCRLVLDLKVFCRHKSKGCQWTGELRDLDKHLDQSGDDGVYCNYVSVQCQYGCGGLLTRHEVEVHELQECPKRPVETQVYQMQQMIKKMKEDHLLEIKALEKKIEEQACEIDDMKTRMNSMEQKANSLQNKLTALEKPPGPPAPPPPPPPAPPPPPIQFGQSLHSISSVPHPPPLPPRPGGIVQSSVLSLPPRIPRFPPPPSTFPLVSALPPPIPPPPPPPPLPPPLAHDHPGLFIKLPNGHTLSVIKSNICFQDVDVIVTSSPRSMKLTNGVSYALNQATRGMLQRHCDRLLLHSGDLAPGDVVVTNSGGGNLKCSHVIHVVLPAVKHPTSSSIKVYYNTFLFKCLDKIESLNVRSVAFAAIGTSGLHGKTPELVASAMLDALVNYPYSAFGTLVDVRIVVIEQRVFQAFVEVVKSKRFSRVKERSVSGRIVDWFRGTNS